ncbi:MAG: hypothetical protein Q8N56_00705 [bacterium]|nr:hypothetical protein [bacterium]
MHPEAKKWDEKNPGKKPRNRPCDWCGKIIEKGYIHKECLEKEEKLYLEIFND